MPVTAPQTPARDRTVLVVGSLNLDTVLSVTRHPKPGETIASTARVHGAGGKGGNQAIAAARAGARVVMVAAVGDDADGATIIDDLVGSGVNVDGVARHAGPSGAATVLVDEDGENLIVVSPGANAFVDDAAIDAALHAVRPGDTIVLQNEIPAAATAHAAAAGREAGATVIWNAAPAPVRLDEIPAADVLVVNAGELAAIASLVDAADRELAPMLVAVSDALEVDVVCTRGPDGVTAILDGEPYDVAAPAVRAIDTTAAGDSFVGYFAANTHLQPAERLRSAAAAGAAAVTRPGAAASIPDPAAVATLLAVRHPDRNR